MVSTTMPREKGNFSFIDVNTSDVAYCPNCEKIGLKIKLKERLYEDGKPIPEDNDNWCQCHRCGLILGIYQRKQEGQFSYFKETVSNPFDTTSKFEASKKRKKKDRLDSYKEREEDL